MPREKSPTEAISLVLTLVTLLMNYCRLRAFETTPDKQKPRERSGSCKFSVRLTCGAAGTPGALRRTESCSRRRVPRPLRGGSTPRTAGMPAGPAPDGGNARRTVEQPGPRSGRNDNARRAAQSRSGSPSTDYTSRDAARQSAGGGVRQRREQPIAARPGRAPSAANLVFAESRRWCCWRRRHIGRDERPLSSSPWARARPPPCCTWRTIWRVSVCAAGAPGGRARPVRGSRGKPRRGGGAPPPPRRRVTDWLPPFLPPLSRSPVSPQ